MGAVETLEDIEQLYSRVLDLTREQEQCLHAGNFNPLPQILLQKTQALDQAQRLTCQMQGSAQDPTSPEFQEALNRVGAILSQMVVAENRCKSLVPAPPKAQAARQATAAYGKAGNRP